MSSIIMTNTDPGEGQSLAPDNYLAVYGGASILDVFYPIGSVYKTYDLDFEPSEVWGGLWQEEPQNLESDVIQTDFIFEKRYSTLTGLFQLPTKKGTVLTFAYTSYGGLVDVVDGAGDISDVDFKHSSRFTSTTSNYGVHNLAHTSAIWTYYSGHRAGTGEFGTTGGASTDGSESISGYTIGYGNLCTIGGNKSMTYFDAHMVRVPGESTWSIKCLAQSSGSGCSLSLNSEVKASSVNAVPSLYQRGFGNTWTKAYTRYTVYEKAAGKYYRVWRRIA